MFATATLVAHRGATLVSREALDKYEPPEPEGRWKPIKHALIVDLMHEELERREIRVVKEEYAIQREGNHLFAALTLNWLHTEEFAAALAFRPYLLWSILPSSLSHVRVLRSKCCCIVLK